MKHSEKDPYAGHLHPVQVIRPQVVRLPDGGTNRAAKFSTQVVRLPDLVEVTQLSKSSIYGCWRRPNFEPPGRSNIEPGVEADFERVGCG
jgi:hypothetical protein